MKSCFSPLQGAGLRSAQPQLWSAAPSFVHLPDLWCSRGRKRSRRRDGGSQRRAGIIRRWTILQGVGVFHPVYGEVHGCLWLFEQLPEPFVLFSRNSASFSASMKIQRVWSLLSLIAVLVSLRPQNISHTQQLSIFTHSAFSCITPRAWNTTIWTRLKTLIG